MKNIFTTLLILLMSVTAFAQESNFKAGVFGAIPVGETKDVSKTGFGIDATYFFDTTSKLNYGLSAGFSTFKGKTVKTTEGDQQVNYTYASGKYVPLTAVVRYKLTDKFFIGTDLGYAVGLGDNVKSGFHYKPRLGYQISEVLSVQSSFTGLKVKGGTWKTVNIGLEFSL